MSKLVEICNECGQSVSAKDGLFVNRVPDGNTYKDRVRMGKPFPEGDYMCAECDYEIFEKWADDEL